MEAWPRPVLVLYIGHLTCYHTLLVTKAGKGRLNKNKLWLITWLFTITLIQHHICTQYCTSNSKPVQKLSTRNKPNDFLNTSLPHLFLKQRVEYLNDFHQFFFNRKSAILILAKWPWKVSCRSSNSFFSFFLKFIDYTCYLARRCEMNRMDYIWNLEHLSFELPD